MYVWNSWYVLYVLVDCQLNHPADSQLMHTTHTICCIYSLLPPDYEQLAGPKHVEVFTFFTVGAAAVVVSWICVSCRLNLRDFRFSLQCCHRYKFVGGSQQYSVALEKTCTSGNPSDSFGGLFCIYQSLSELCSSDRPKCLWHGSTVSTFPPPNQVHIYIYWIVTMKMEGTFWKHLAFYKSTEDLHLMLTHNTDELWHIIIYRLNIRKSMIFGNKENDR
jgi:hypothetical protein